MHAGRLNMDMHGAQAPLNPVSYTVIGLGLTRANGRRSTPDGTPHFQRCLKQEWCVRTPESHASSGCYRSFRGLDWCLLAHTYAPARCSHCNLQQSRCAWRSDLLNWRTFNAMPQGGSCESYHQANAAVRLGILVYSRGCVPDDRLSSARSYRLTEI